MNNAEKVKAMLDQRAYLMDQCEKLASIQTITRSHSNDKTYGLFAGFHTQVRADLNKKFLLEMTEDMRNIHASKLAEIDKRLEAMAMLSVV